MSLLICPVCGAQLTKNEKTYICQNKHSFDISKQGYVNLLQSQQSSLKHHGDDKLMIKSRRDFLSKGYYECFKDALINSAAENIEKSDTVIDAGCGEGYYTNCFINSRLLDIKNLVGIDISKDAVAFAAKKCKAAEFAVASVFKIPVADNKADIVFNIFSPGAFEEFNRVLKPGGILVTAYPLERHLIELKNFIYNKAYENDSKPGNLLNYETLNKYEIRNSIKLTDNEDILNLFRMTPYYYKTGVEDQKKLQNINELSITLEFGINIYKKI